MLIFYVCLLPQLGINNAFDFESPHQGRVPIFKLYWLAFFFFRMSFSEDIKDDDSWSLDPYAHDPLPLADANSDGTASYLSLEPFADKPPTINRCRFRS